jgi:hypothetical protein
MHIQVYLYFEAASATSNSSRRGCTPNQKEPMCVRGNEKEVAHSSLSLVADA